MQDLEKYKLEQVPPTAYYIPDYISESDEKYLMTKIEQTPAPRWTQLANRRLQNWGGVPHPKGMIAEKIPEWLQTYVDRVNSMQLFEEKRANHVLLNEYLPGQGIMPHLDGPMFYPTISTISLGSHTVINFYKQGDAAECTDDCDMQSMLFKNRLVTSLVLEPRSLLVLKDDLYNKYLHGIEEVKEDVLSDKLANIPQERYGTTAKRGSRISLTIRHVPKTSKLKLMFGK